MQNLHAKSTSISRTMSPFNEKEGALTCHNAPFHSGGTSPIGFSGFMNKKMEKSFGPKLGKQYSRTPTMAHEGLVNAKLQYHSHGMKNENLIKSGPLGMCNKIDCVQCPGAYRAKQEGNKEKKVQLENKLYKILYGDSKGWARKVVASLNSNLPIMNPHTKIVQQWNKFFVISCLVAIFTDPLFFFLLNVDRQISTLAGNLVQSDFEFEVIFTLGIIGLGLLLFAMLIGNMQNFLLALGRRRLEMQLRRRDVEKWMIHRQLPEVLQRRVRQAERFTWVATRGVDEEELLEHLPEDLQRDIRRHFFLFL